jgi:preprotein translocase subunit SecD
MLGRANTPVASAKTRTVDRQLAYKNLRTGLIAGAIALIVFALSWVVGLVY